MFFLVFSALLSSASICCKSFTLFVQLLLIYFFDGVLIVGPTCICRVRVCVSHRINCVHTIFPSTFGSFDILWFRLVFFSSAVVIVVAVLLVMVMNVDHIFSSVPFFSLTSISKKHTIAFSNNKFHNNKHETARIWNVHTLFVWFSLCIATATVTAKPTKGTWKQCKPNPNPKSNSICECRNSEPSKEPNRKSKSIHVTKHSQCTDPNKKQYAKQLNGPIEHIVKWTKCQSILWPCEKRKEPRRKRRKK